MKKLLIVLVLLLPVLTLAQNLKQTVCCHTYSRIFRPMGLTHVAQYAFYPNKVVYKVNGFFINLTYSIVGKYYKSEFIGKDPKTNRKYILYFKSFSPKSIVVKKHGVYPGYQWIINKFHVETWHKYTR